MNLRRFLFWYFPLSLSLVCAGVFAYGFSLLFRDDLGVAVTPPVVREAPTKDETGPLKIVLLGDSVARGTGDSSGEGIGGHVASVLDERNVAHDEPLNLAVNGARTLDLLEQIGESTSVRGFVASADVIIVSIGGNDLWGDSAIRSDERPPDPEQAMNRVEKNVVEVLSALRAVNSDARIFYVGLYNPFRESETPFSTIVDIAVSEWQARLVRHFANDPNLTVVQTFDIFSHNDRLSSDRFHPGAEGYELIGRRIGEGI